MYACIFFREKEETETHTEKERQRQRQRDPQKKISNVKGRERCCISAELFSLNENGKL